MTATRFTENDIWLGEEFRKRNKKYFFVRTKIQIDVDSDSKDHRSTHNEEAVVNGIREWTTKALRKHGFDDGPVFLIDNHNPEKFDFERLKLQLIEHFPALKKSALIFSLQANSEQMIRLKVAALRSRIWKLAAISGVVGAIPIPGPSVVADVSIIIGESMFYYKQLGLDDESLRRYAVVYSVDYNKLKLMVSSALGLKAAGAVTADAMKASLLLILPSSASLVASTSAKVGLKMLPIIGSLIGAPASFGGTYASLKFILDKFQQVAIDVLKYLTESVANTQESGTADETSGSAGGQGDDQRSIGEETRSAATLVLENVD